MEMAQPLLKCLGVEETRITPAHVTLSRASHIAYLDARGGRK